jgi:hypothetical protein
MSSYESALALLRSIVIAVLVVLVIMIGLPALLAGASAGV